jgi:pyruvate/2-oxoglutarate dehydrogenase complex dihydrolipoamide acyltransferase (E2) component
MFLSAGSSPTVITDWKAELDSTVIKDAVICEVSTNKVSMEFIAPHTGQLAWLLKKA